MTNPTHIYPTTLMKSLHKSMSVLAFLCALTIALQSSQAQTFAVIHNFSGGGDGSSPKAGVAVDRAGNLYGTAYSGGASANGVVYRLKQRNGNWTLTPLYNFAGGNDGANPYGRVAIAQDGTLYGTTFGGGGGCSGYGCGTVFHLTPPASAPRSALAPWSETVFFDFGPLGFFGEFPQGDLTFDQSGNIYGTTTYTGGATPYGVIYELTPTNGVGTQTVLYRAQGNFRGAYPYGGVVRDNGGNLYGTMSAGDDSAGIVYQLSPSGSDYTEYILHAFEGSDGAAPFGGLIFDPLGNLYGTTSSGGDSYGTVFELMSVNGGWVFSTLYRFESGAVNGGPQDKLAMDSAGNLYGTTYAGGVYEHGSVFKLTNSNGQWIYSSIHDFTGGMDGGNPISNITFDGSGNLYGTAWRGGSGSVCQSGCGIVWEIMP